MYYNNADNVRFGQVFSSENEACGDGDSYNGNGLHRESEPIGGDSMYHITSLNVGYGGKVIVRNLNLHLRPGRIYTLIGSNGAGKSTILRTLAGLQKPLSGKLELCGRSPEQYTARELSKILSVVLTERLQLGLQKVFEVVLLGRLPFAGYFGTLSEEDKRIASESLECVGAAHLSARDFDSLSDGEKQKVMIARALAQQPRVMILDEPTSHLDIKHRIEIMKILKRLAQSRNVTVLMSLHDVDLAMKISDEVIILKGGEAVYSGITEKVSLHVNLSDIYDLTNSHYHDELGSIEIKNDNLERILIVGGGKTAVPVLRLLSKSGIGAVLYGAAEGELDYEIARAMGIRIINARIHDEKTESVKNPEIFENVEKDGNLQTHSESEMSNVSEDSQNTEIPGCDKYVARCVIMEWVEKLNYIIVANSKKYEELLHLIEMNCNRSSLSEADFYERSGNKICVIKSDKVFHFSAECAEEVHNIVRRLQ